MDHGVLSGRHQEVLATYLVFSCPTDLQMECALPLQTTKPSGASLHVISFARPSPCINTASRDGLGTRLCMFMYQQLTQTILLVKNTELRAVTVKCSL